jgi:transcription elongation factor Elf1
VRKIAFVGESVPVRKGFKKAKHHIAFVGKVPEVDLQVTDFHCPRCNSLLFCAGKIKPVSKDGKAEPVKVYYCKICKWRGI